MMVTICDRCQSKVGLDEAARHVEYWPDFKANAIILELCAPCFDAFKVWLKADKVEAAKQCLYKVASDRDTQCVLNYGHEGAHKSCDGEHWFSWERINAE